MGRDPGPHPGHLRPARHIGGLLRGRDRPDRGQPDPDAPARTRGRPGRRTRQPAHLRPGDDDRGGPAGQQPDQHPGLCRDDRVPDPGHPGRLGRCGRDGDHDRPGARLLGGAAQDPRHPAVGRCRPVPVGTDPDRREGLRPHHLDHPVDRPPHARPVRRQAGHGDGRTRGARGDSRRRRIPSLRGPGGGARPPDARRGPGPLGDGRQPGHGPPHVDLHGRRRPADPGSGRPRPQERPHPHPALPGQP